MTTPTDINTICSIRKRQQIFNQPLNRLEIISPYKNTNFTTYQLNMKRKVQILKYENDSSKETTSSSWSRLSRNRNNLNFILRKDQSFYDKNTNKKIVFNLSEKKSGTLYVPPKIWFAFQNIDKKKDSLLINFSNIIHDKKEVINKDYEQI